MSKKVAILLVLITLTSFGQVNAALLEPFKGTPYDQWFSIDSGDMRFIKLKSGTEVVITYNYGKSGRMSIYSPVSVVGEVAKWQLNGGDIKTVTGNTVDLTGNGMALFYSTQQSTIYPEVPSNGVLWVKNTGMHDILLQTTAGYVLKTDLPVEPAVSYRILPNGEWFPAVADGQQMPQDRPTVYNPKDVEIAVAGFEYVRVYQDGNKLFEHSLNKQGGIVSLDAGGLSWKWINVVSLQLTRNDVDQWYDVSWFYSTAAPYANFTSPTNQSIEYSPNVYFAGGFYNRGTMTELLLRLYQNGSIQREINVTVDASGIWHVMVNGMPDGLYQAQICLPDGTLLTGIEFNVSVYGGGPRPPGTPGQDAGLMERIEWLGQTLVYWLGAPFRLAATALQTLVEGANQLINPAGQLMKVTADVFSFLPAPMVAVVTAGIGLAVVLRLLGR